MIVERHYDDETLIGLLGSNLDAAKDPHLAVCSTCSENLDSYRAIADVLGHDAAWDLRDLRQEPVPETIASLRMFTSVFAAEDEKAQKAVAALLAQPKTTWNSAISHSLELQSAAAVNAFVAVSEKAIDRDPSEALAIAGLATRVAQLLKDDAYSKGVISRAVGTAWRQYAYAAFYVGEFPAATDAVAKSRAAFESCAVSDYDLARLAIVRSLILSQQDQHDAARDEVRHAAAVFEAFGDRGRAASAMVAEAYSLISQQHFNEALPILKTVERDYAADMDNYARANVANNLAICYTGLGSVMEAFDQYSIAATIYDEIGNAPEAARVRHNLGWFLAEQGRLRDAQARFRSVRMEFRKLGMADAAVAADLDLAELLLAENAHAEAEALCSAAVEQFQKTGLSATTRGLTALTFLREAAAQRRATPEAARHVRRYLERLPKEPELLFAPPPLPAP
ncbi:MAG TPA: tetratricopeptide repeat protein [Thermoanaerobaculia bacterium]|nr:tetratricopeptide repeat protein [Thermoanaerobaculia bacterium]